jgi:hypothetical protein
MRQPTAQPKQLTETKGLTIPVGPFVLLLSPAMVRHQTLFRALPVLDGLRLFKKNRASERLPGSGSPVIR